MRNVYVKFILCPYKYVACPSMHGLVEIMKNYLFNSDFQLLHKNFYIKIVIIVCWFDQWKLEFK